MMIKTVSSLYSITGQWDAPDTLLWRHGQRLFDQAYSRGWWRRIRARLTGRSYDLLNLAEIEVERRVGRSSAGKTQLVSLDQIRGSAGRCIDFDNAFYPRQHHTRDRWLHIALAYQVGAALPLVELIRVKDVYYVIDGHHRISVARALGQLEIEANVSVW
jgi:hypothetical protein